MDGERSVLLANLFDAKTVEVLKRLLHKKDVFYLRDVARESSVSLATTFRIVQKLITLGLVKKVQQDKFVFYHIVRDTPIFNEIHALIVGSAPDPIKLFKDKLLERFNNFTIYKDKDKKLFVVGDEIKNGELDELAKSIQDQTGTKINFMILQSQMFDSMNNMGLISKDKLNAV
ncbi:MAG: helix-turn-helix domain-containing protein [DPANN group archaeon]|nr:helix-turn-helix domain-containing protein [DPANN group archaeon]